MRERHGPKLGRRAEDMYEALAVAGAQFGAVGKANKVGMVVVSKLDVEVLSWSDCKRQ
jgi:hypothetical protein